MRILFNSLSDNLGGVENYVFGFVKYLREQNVEIGFLTNSENMYYQKELLNLGCVIHKVNFNRRKNLFGYKKNLKYFFDNNKYDMFYFNACSASFVEPLIQAKKHGVICVAHSHSAWKSKGISSILHKLNKKRFNKQLDLAFACSDKAGVWLFDENIIEFTYIQNGIDIEKFKFKTEIRNNLKKEYNLSDKEIILGHIGSLTYIKNQKFLLQLIYELKNLGYNYKLVLVGDGPDYKDLFSICEKLNILNNVIFTGIKSANEILNLFDVFLFPSLFEGLPISVIEAQANGLPVIMSDNISKQVVATDDVCLVPLTDRKKWLNLILSFVNKGRSDNSLKLKEKGFDSEGIYNKVYNILLDFINGRYA